MMEKELEETRFLIIISMLKGYPNLKKRVRDWLEENP